MEKHEELIFNIRRLVNKMALDVRAVKSIDHIEEKQPIVKSKKLDFLESAEQINLLTRIFLENEHTRKN